MKYDVTYEKQCVKYLKRLDKNTQIRILQAINRLPLGDVKKLQGNTQNYRLRVGSYRIIFSKDDEKFVILILEVLPRGGAYNRL